MVRHLPGKIARMCRWPSLVKKGEIVHGEVVGKCHRSNDQIYSKGEGQPTTISTANTTRRQSISMGAKFLDFTKGHENLAPP